MKSLSSILTACVFLALVGTPVMATVHNIDVGDFYFSPTNTWVEPGDTVKWTLINGTHITTSDVSSPKQWDSDTLDTPGQTYIVVFEAADGIGPFPYHCEFNPDSMKDTIFQNLPPEFQPVDTLCGEVSQVLSFDVTAVDPNGTIPSLTTSSLPTGALFIDYANGTGNLQWTPGTSQYGFYEMTFYASDGWLEDTMIVIILIGGCAGGDPTFSTTDPVMILSPEGNVLFHVTLKDNAGLPVQGSVNCWLDFSQVSGLTASCASQTAWPLVYPTDTSDADGLLSIRVPAGGCSEDSVKVMSTHGEIARVPIKSLDHDGSLRVTAADFVGDDCNDYNDDDTVGTADWDFFEKYVGQFCIDELAHFVLVSAYTVPGPGGIFWDDTIQVCGKIINTLNEALNLDSVIFSDATWGIAQTWVTSSKQYDVNLPPLDTIDVCAEFVVPWISHGCLRVSAWPSYPSAISSTAKAVDRGAEPDRQSRPQGSSSTGDINIDPVPCSNSETHTPTAADPDGDGVPDDGTDKCTETIPCCPIDTDPARNGCGVATFYDGKYCYQTPPPSMGRTLTHYFDPGKAKPTRYVAMASYQTNIPIGSEFGDSLLLYEIAFLPLGWSYETSDTDWINTPGTLFVEVLYDQIIKCDDTGRIIFYAYNDAEQYAGKAEIHVYTHGTKGDVDSDGDINVADLTYLVDYLFRGGEPPPILQSADLNNDGDLNVADLTYLVDYLFRGGPPPPC